MSNEEVIGILGLGLAASIVVIVVFLIIYYVVMAIAEWRIFAKTGEKGWKALIPVVREFTLYKICWQTKVFWVVFILGIISSIVSGYEDQTMYATIAKWVLNAAAFVISIIQCVKLSKAFGHGKGFAVGLVLLAPVFMLILGYGSSQYIGNPTASAEKIES